MDRYSADVVVVGGGLAGLRAASLLVAKGRSVRVLEARDRVGGRTESRRIGRAVFDVGGQWLGPKQRRALALSRELGLELFPTFHEGKKLLDLGGELSSYSGSIPNLGPLALLELQLLLMRIKSKRYAVPSDAPHHAPDARALDAQSVATWATRSIRSKKVRAVLEAASRVVWGADLSEIPLLYFLWYAQAGGSFMELVEIAGGAQEQRFVGGAQGLSLGLAERLGDRVLCEQPVTRVSVEGSRVRVVARSVEVECERVICATPPGLARRITWEPLLPPARRALLERVHMGSTTKVLALYDSPFWRARGLSGELVSDRGPLVVTFDNTSSDGEQAALLGFVVGSPARQHAARSERERREAVLAQLARAFGPEAATPTELIEKDWSEDRYSLGCPVSVFGSGALSELGAALRAPCGPIHWAGTETATEWPGYLEGALQSAERAVAEITGG